MCVFEGILDLDLYIEFSSLIIKAEHWYFQRNERVGEMMAIFCN